GPVARLGEGDNYGFSPDGKWALSRVSSSPPRLMIYPLGPGAPMRLNRGEVTEYSDGTPQWYPDSRRVLYCGAEGTQPPRCYRQTIDGGTPDAVTPTGFTGASLAPDGQTVLLQRTDGAWHLMRAGGSVQPFVALSAPDHVIGWTADSRAVYVQRGRFQPTGNV